MRRPVLPSLRLSTLVTCFLFALWGISVLCARAGEVDNSPLSDVVGSFTHEVGLLQKDEHAESENTPPSLPSVSSSLSASQEENHAASLKNGDSISEREGTQNSIPATSVEAVSPLEATGEGTISDTEKEKEKNTKGAEELPPARKGPAGMRRRRLDGLVPGFFKRRSIHKALPVFPEKKFPEVATHKVKASFFSSGGTGIQFLRNPSKRLLKFLGLEKEDAPYGIVIKMKPHDAFDMYDVIGEGYLHRMFDDQEKFPWVLPLLGVYRGEEKRAVYLFFPYYRTLPGSVAKYANSLDFRMLLAQLLTAVADLHERHLVHRDLKDDNFLVDPEGNVVVSDMETVALSGEKGYYVGTGGFMPPETQSSFFIRDGWMKVVYDDSTDVYSLGVTFLELLKDVEKYSKKSVPGRRALLTLINQMKRKNPKHRPNVHAIMEDNYFEGVNFALLRKKRLSPVFPPMPGAEAFARRRKQKLEEKKKAEGNKNKPVDETKKKKKEDKGGKVAAAPEKTTEKADGAENKETDVKEETKEGSQAESEEDSHQEKNLETGEQQPMETEAEKEEMESSKKQEETKETEEENDANKLQEEVQQGVSEKEEEMFHNVPLDDNEDEELSREEGEKTQPADNVDSLQVEEDAPIVDEESASQVESPEGDADTATTASGTTGSGKESIFGEEEEIPLDEDEQVS
ncbi:rhoptry kinase family protein rop35 [Cystoisospora suis]|uniref:Rhoptry kinase family protein rop35 n=1 Tax=Cystoisospora suis TaxID=483139 RepID=A0A2C6L273_9APIC|nr:rhoptry kinase family protein rop35 [Cystoisospora suis]